MQQGRSFGEEEAEAVEVENFGEGFLVDDGVGHGGFLFLQGADFFLDGVLGDEAVGDDRFDLADPVGAINGLGFGGGIPPRIVEDNVAGGGEVKAGAGGFEGEKKDGDGGIGLEFFHEFLTVFGLAGEGEMGDGLAGEFVGDEAEHCQELGEDEDLVVFLDQGPELIEESFHLGAGGGFFPAPGYEAGVAAYLPEAEEGLEDIETGLVEGVFAGEAENEAAGFFEFGAVEGGLGAIERAVEFLLGAGGEFGGAGTAAAAATVIAGKGGAVATTGSAGKRRGGGW